LHLFTTQLVYFVWMQINCTPNLHFYRTTLLTNLYAKPYCSLYDYLIIRGTNHLMRWNSLCNTIDILGLIWLSSTVNTRRNARGIHLVIH
jgi:hypothetical protein